MKIESPEVNRSHPHGNPRVFAGMYRFSGRPGERQIRMTLAAPWVYGVFLISALFAVIPNILIRLVSGRTIIFLPFPFCLWTVICLSEPAMIYMIVRMYKPYIDMRNGLYWPLRVPGVGNPRYRERCRAIELAEIVTLQVTPPIRPVPIFGGHQLNAVMRDGSKKTLMTGAENRIRHNAETLAKVLGISLEDCHK
ncbi:MAG: hypothetical protein V8T90_05100 [Victivallales bacterium]